MNNNGKRQFRKLKDTKDTFTMHLLDSEMCIFAQDRPYENSDLMVKLIMDFNLDKDLGRFELEMGKIKVAIDIAYHHADGHLLQQGNVVKKFIYISSLSDKKFSVNGRTNVKESMHTSFLKYLKSIGVINSDREVQKDCSDKVILPDRAGLEG